MISNSYRALLVGSLAFLIVLGVPKWTKATEIAPGKYQTITLSKKNTVTFHSVFTGDSVAKAQNKLLQISAGIPKDEPIFLYLFTPGGNIVSGEELIVTAKGLPHEVKTVTSFAASMGFITAQSLGERLILPNGILMSHRAKVGIESQLPGEFVTQSTFWTSLVTNIETEMAARMNMTLPNYQAMIHEEYWVTGEKAVADHAADRVVNAKCADDLSGSYVEKINTFFGPINVTWSECPLISSPLSVGFSELSGAFTDSVEIEQTKRSVFEALTNPRSFINNQALQKSYFNAIK